MAFLRRQFDQGNYTLLDMNVLTVMYVFGSCWCLFLLKLDYLFILFVGFWLQLSDANNFVV